MLLLDTNVVSELRKVGDGRADPGVMAWLARTDAGLEAAPGRNPVLIPFTLLSLEDCPGLTVGAFSVSGLGDR